VCATWHCKHDRGQVGLRFWRDLASLLREIELAIGTWCVAELHGEAAALEQALDPEGRAASASDLGAPPDLGRYKTLWGSWAGRESDFYVQSAERTDRLGWADVERIGGVRLRALADLTRKSHAAATSLEVPARVKISQLQVLGTTNGKWKLETYSSLDPVQIPDTLFRLLPCFDGRSTEEVLEEIHQRENVRVQAGLVRRLADFGILTPVREPDPEPTGS
jgi:hypothetical protein